MNKLILIVGCFYLTACGGGGGGSSSSPSTSVPQVIKYPQAKCGSKDCVTGDSVSGYSVNNKPSDFQSLSGGGDYYDQVKTSYSNIKGRLEDVKSLVEIINMMADDEGISSCDEIPTSGTYTWNDTFSLVFNSGDESWNLGSGSVSMTHKIKMTSLVDSGVTLFEFKCDTSTLQSLHIRTAYMESFSQIESATNEVHLQVADIPSIATSTVRQMAYFNSDGSDSFSLGYFYSDTNDALVRYQVVATSFEDATYSQNASDWMEYAYAGALGATDIDTVSFGSGTDAYRSCVYQYRSSSPSNFYDNSCDMANTTQKYATVSATASGVLLGDATAWSLSELNGMTIDDPSDD